ncbi:MAG TPA: BatD family protein [Methanothrix sp.]|nr:BatD family protein [Methanothrix sp.]
MMHGNDIFGKWRLFYPSGLFSLIIVVFLIASACTAKSDSDDDGGVSFKDFTLNIGDRIDLSNYRMELIEIQSIRDGLVVMRVSSSGGSLDEQRAFLLNSANNFDGGAEKMGITITVTDILDENSAIVRVEYNQELGTPRKRTSERAAVAPEKPELSVQKTFDRNQMNVGDEVKATITVKNTGTGQALNINVQDVPPLSEFSYVAGYPPKIKETLDPDESDSAVYVMDAVKEGSVRVPAVTVTYTDNKRNSKSNSSEPFDVIINPKSKAILAIKMDKIAPIALDGEGLLNISISNSGTASATRIEATGYISPSDDGLLAEDLDKSFFDIAPGEEVSYTSRLSGNKPGEYDIDLKVSYDEGSGSVIKEATIPVRVLEREYKYQYLLLIIPFAIIFAWVYRRYKEYKY